MTGATTGVLRNGEEFIWEQGVLVCIKKKNGKYRLAVRNSKSVIKNNNNKWVYKEEFEYISEPEQYIMIVRYAEKSRLLDLLSGKYITNESLYIKEKIGEKCYMARYLNKDKEFILNLK